MRFLINPLVILIVLVVGFLMSNGAIALLGLGWGIAVGVFLAILNGLIAGCAIVKLEELVDDK